jgi:hypothetical protein
MLLALFLIALAAGLYLFLPLVGRRNAGVKFYRLVMVVSATLALGAAVAHVLAGRRMLASLDGTAVVLTAATVVLLRYPKRLLFRAAAALLGGAYLASAVIAYDAAVQPPHGLWTAAGSLTTIGLLGSVNLAMTLGHWYLVVRGMSIAPLKRLAVATLVCSIAKLIVVALAMTAGGVLQQMAIGQGIFFLMRAGWGLLGPLVLFPMVWGTVRIRSTMAATGILYVDVVAVVIGEVLGIWLSAMARVPV